MKFLAVLAAVLAGSGAQAPKPVPSFRHVVVIVFENKEASSILGNRDAPTFNGLARRYARLTRYYGVTHPSLPNYLALVSGSTQGITTDCTTCLVSARNIADTLEGAAKTWKLYAEGLPQSGFTGPSAGLYAKKHVPLLYFRDVLDTKVRLDRVVPFTELQSDVRASALPDFAFVVPNLCHSMHDCPVRTGDAWLHSMLPPLLRLAETVVFVVFDEGSSDARGGGHVDALALGTAVRRGVSYTRITGHYALLRTVEAAWGLPLLGRSAQVKPVTGIWQ